MALFHLRGKFFVFIELFILLCYNKTKKKYRKGEKYEQRYR